MDGYKKNTSKKVLDKKFIKSGYSILTTPKYDWYESINGEKDWSKTQHLIVRFWKEFQNLKNGVFYNIIFPILPIEVKEEVKYFIINLNNISAIKFISCTFEDEIDFSDIEFKVPLDFSKTIFKEDANFGGNIFDNLSFNKVDFQKNILLQYQKLKIIRIEETLFNGNLLFTPFTSNQSEENKISEIFFQKVTFNPNSSILFKNFNLEKIEFENINNISKNIIFSNIKIDRKLVISNSALGIMEFNNINISSIKNFNIINSSISCVKFNNLNWCNISNIETNRDGFRQLKMALNSSHDYATANVVHSYEMYKYCKELYNEFFELNKSNSDNKENESTNKKKNILNNIKNYFLFLEKKSLLLFNYRISIFSQSWLMPIIWIFIFHFIFSLVISIFPSDYNLIFSAIFIAWGITFSSLISKFENIKLLKLTIFIFISIILLFLIDSELFRTLIDGIKFYYSPIHMVEGNYKIPLWFFNKFTLSIFTYHLVISLRKPTKA